jgi:hypothetical protein
MNWAWGFRDLRIKELRNLAFPIPALFYLSAMIAKPKKLSYYIYIECMLTSSFILQAFATGRIGFNLTVACCS